MSSNIKVAILGGGGFVGMETYRLLKEQADVSIEFVSSESLAGQPVEKYYRMLNSKNKQLRFKPVNHLEEGFDVVFSCLPTGILPAYIDEIKSKSKIIFNVSGDYRLTDQQQLEKYYPQSLKTDTYLESQYYIPEFHELDKKAKIINLPGCMAVASIYSLYPLVEHNMIEGKVVIDAKTGSSGGGKRSSEHPAERAHNLRPHKVHGHRHQPEICHAFKSMFGTELDLQFSTYSLDLPRGIMVTSYSQLKKNIAEVDVKKAFYQAYKDKPFIEYIKDNKSARFNPMIKSTVGTNKVEVAAYLDGKHCVSISTLDNMIKGAAGQAIQAFNHYFDYPEMQSLNFNNEGMWP
ncbi:N-acetyl-gamma-glutamyl-phosphate reductase [Salipaludibacillus sp. LMS25]|jgi:N-acetyl-gamma-glutamyl-phosphate reductase|uniref:N-acetyl-gamma-glutamyl-phosphate reductase n=1 Tax=Salipaludibacillus sp. LMS25 TaxID=2924031 RepID=UPI0020D113CF|nr:N-acetyl-gamma-glutamyl-phosphate reductase [Salipaludibacillus sp. LMS25]UTR16513.1 N-acetyl-gamma-glutamyl-phosphate reductase [Salipaludibacillus sp. LMS25]